MMLEAAAERRSVDQAGMASRWLTRRVTRVTEDGLRSLD